MGNIQQRAGKVVIRVGGNTQETAVLVDSTPDGRILEKDLTRISNPVRFMFYSWFSWSFSLLIN
jgi:hypothetical protein